MRAQSRLCFGLARLALIVSILPAILGGCHVKTAGEAEVTEDAAQPTVSDVRPGQHVKTAGEAEVTEDAAQPTVSDVRPGQMVTEALRSGQPLHPLIAQLGREKVLGHLSAALGSEDAKVRQGCLKYILARDSIADASIVPAAQELLRKMDVMGGALQDSDRGNETLAIVRVLRKFPQASSVPLLLQLAEANPFACIGPVYSARGEQLPMDDYSFYFPIIAAALRNCSRGVVGEITGGSWSSPTNRERLLSEWKSAWSRHTEEREEGSD
jgi:hypothetical protein